MNSDVIMQAAMTLLRYIAVVVSHRSLLKSLVAYALLFFTVLMLQPISARAGVFSQETGVNNGGKSFQIASLGDTLPRPKGDSVPDIDKVKGSGLMSAETYNDQGVVYSGKGQYDLALSEFNKALKIDPMSAVTYNNRGITYSKQGKYDLAIADFTKAVEINPQDAKILFNRGVTYAVRGLYDLALLDFNRSLEIHSSDASAHDIRGSIHVELACLDWKQACNFGNCDHLKEATKAGLCTQTNGTDTLLQ